MAIFSYDRQDAKTEYYEVLAQLMEAWEHELVEFKEAKGQYSEDKIGQYFSAISNEANLRDKQYGWLILGVSEQSEKHPVGTAFKQGSSTLLEHFKYAISKNLTDGMTFLDIVELYPVYAGEPKRVLMFKIPAAVAGMPTAWNGRYFARNGESLVPLQQYKIDEIRGQFKRDWSNLLIPNSGLQHLDKEAVALARQKYKEKMARPHITEEVDAMTDEDFLTKIRLMRNGQLTNAALVLLGSAEHDYLLDYPPVMMWRLYAADGELKDYAIYTIPFLTVEDKILPKIRNLVYRYMTNPQSLFPSETEQYDMWMLRELLHNCIAHTNYQLGGRIYVNEGEDSSITITNPGDFLPKRIETVLQAKYNPPFYRNRLLVDAMVNFGMIDTATSGIKKVYRIQKEKFFPMPDYDLKTPNQVGVTVYGKIIDQQYTYILFKHPEFDLERVYLLDQVQKNRGQDLSRAEISYLRKHNLVEGHAKNLFLSSQVAQLMKNEAQYIKNRAFDDQYYRDLIVSYLQEFGKAQKKDLRKLLWDKLPDVLNDKQKERRIALLLEQLRKQGVIKTDSTNKRNCNWILNVQAALADG